jgi:hypothetical protein
MAGSSYSHTRATNNNVHVRNVYGSYHVGADILTAVGNRR